jgi:hypothetical protein
MGTIIVIDVPEKWNKAMLRNSINRTHDIKVPFRILYKQKEVDDTE